MLKAPSVLNIHTPDSSFAIVHNLTQETLLDLFNKLSRKLNTVYYGERVGPGWLKYEYNDAIWNLDDESDYTIFVWRRQQQEHQDDLAHSIHSLDLDGPPVPSSSKTLIAPKVIAPQQTTQETPTLHLHDPFKPLPSAPAYLNASYYMFQPSRAHIPTSKRVSPAPSRTSTRKSKKGEEDLEENGVPKFKKEFNRFHSENGVRTVMGTIGTVKNVRMLLKSGYRHVYLSRKFAIKHGFIPADAAPGNYGYGGLVNIGSWPITLVPSAHQPHLSLLTPSHTPYSSPRIPTGSLPRRNQSPSRGDQKPKNTRKKHANGDGERSPSGGANAPVPSKPTYVQVYLSEEPHFDVVLGRSFFEKRQIKTSTIDPTDVVCLDIGEKIECELVILKDGRGEIVTVT